MQRFGIQFSARLWWATLVGGAAVLGCASVIDRPPALPARHAVVLDQLVIHSDVQVPQHHRVLEDLRALRAGVQAKLGLSLSDEPIHVYLFESETSFAAFAREKYPEFPTRRAFFVQSDTSLAVYAHWGDRVAEDLRHEVAHGYLHSVLPSIPLWLDEGLAEYFEVPRGAGGLNRPHLELLRAQTETAGWQPDLARLEALASAAEMTQIDYAQSWAWVHMLLESIPQRRDLLQGYLRQLARGSAGEPLSAAMKRSMAQPAVELRQHLANLPRS